jgi:hypothetical protein
MGCSQSSKFACAPLMPVAKNGFLLLAPSCSNTFRKPNCDMAARNIECSGRGFSTVDLRHSFAIKALEKRGIFKPRPYVYICLRCRYTFLVNERRGSIVALDRKAQPIPEPENSRRLATFAQGPCPSFKAATRHTRRETVELSKPKKLSPSGILELFARIGAKMSYPYSVENDIYPPAGILPQDLLS